MSHLEEEHPDVIAYFRPGGFSVQIGAGNPFSRIPVNQTCEETINKRHTDTWRHKGVQPEARSREQILLYSGVSKHIHVAV